MSPAGLLGLGALCECGRRRWCAPSRRMTSRWNGGTGRLGTWCQLYTSHPMRPIGRSGLRVGPTLKIRRRRAQDVADTTDSLRAVACIFFVLRRFTTDSLMTTPTPPIPERHLALCRAIGALAKEHGLSQLTTTFTPPFDDEWRDAITMRWESGRHGDASGRVYIESTVRVHTALSENDQAHL